VGSVSSAGVPVIRSCSRLTVAAAASVLIPSRENRSTTFIPAPACCPSALRAANLGCRFCQNWDISKAREFDKLADAATPEMIAGAAQRLGCKSVAFTYNDPVIFAEYAMDVADACRACGIKTVAVTAGYMTGESRPEFYRHMDAANVDLKGFTGEFYRKLCFGELQPVLDTLKFSQARNQRLVRNHLAAHSRRETTMKPSCIGGGMGRRESRPRRAVAFHRVPSRFQNARPSAHAAGHTEAGAGNRLRQRNSTTFTLAMSATVRAAAPSARIAAHC